MFKNLQQIKKKEEVVEEIFDPVTILKQLRPLTPTLETYLWEAFHFVGGILRPRADRYKKERKKKKKERIMTADGTSSCSSQEEGTRTYYNTKQKMSHSRRKGKGTFKIATLESGEVESTVQRWFGDFNEWL